MIDRSALASNTFESKSSFEKVELWLVKCAECGKVYGNGNGAVLFRSIGKALEVISESKDWWVFRGYGLKVLCSDCYQKLKNRLEDESSSDVMMLVGEVVL
jgi:ribosomal protein S27E